MSNPLHLPGAPVLVAECPRWYRDRGGSGLDGDYLDLESAPAGQDLTLPGAYDLIASLVDVDNVLDYFATQIYYANYDWPGNNSKCWRPREPGARWRWLTYHLDHSTGLGSWSAWRELDGATGTVTVEDTGPATAQFYRVRDTAP